MSDFLPPNLPVANEPELSDEVPKYQPNQTQRNEAGRASPKPFSNSPRLLPGSEKSSFQPEGNANPAIPEPPQKRVEKPLISIRTMEDDLKSSARGEISKGTEVKIPETAPLPVGSLKDKEAENISKNTKQAPVPLVKIGKAEKSQIFKEAELYKKTPPSPSPQKQNSGIITLPPKSSRFFSFDLGNKNLIIILIAVILLGGGSYLFFTLRQKQDIEEVIPTFTPRVITTVDPVKRLKEIFNANAEINIPDLLTNLDAKDLFSTLESAFLNTENANSFANLAIDSQIVNFLEFGEQFLNNDKTFSDFQNLKDFIFEDRFGLILSKQTERFDKSGQSVDILENDRRLGLIVEVSDEALAKQSLLQWEPNMPSDFKDLFSLELEKDKIISFQDNVYKDISIRFANFPQPDKSIDYAIVTATDNKRYLLFASSRLQMYRILDDLLGF